MTNTKIDPVNLNSDLRNFRDSEVEILARYTEQFKKSALQRPEMTLYNWTRFVRTNEITRFLTFYETYKHIQEIQGSVFQVGVLEGNTPFSFAHLIENFEARNYTRKIYAFDTYGVDDYSQISPHDAQYLDSDVKTIPKVSSLADLKQSAQLFNDSRLFSQFNQIEFVEGDAAITVPQFLDSNPGTLCALLNLQISLYSVEKTVLRAVWPRIPLGGVVHFASLGYEGSPSVGKMLDEVLGITNIRVRRYPFATKMSYIVKE